MGRKQGSSRNGLEERPVSDGGVKLEIRPISLKAANRYVEKYHRHHGTTTGHKFSICVCAGDEIAGVAICGRPVSRYLDDGTTIEVNRLCTNGARNACSMLYGAFASSTA